MTFYELWPQIKTGSIAKRQFEEEPSSETPNFVYLKFNGSRIEKKTEVGNTIVDWFICNLNDTDVNTTGWELV